MLQHNIGTVTNQVMMLLTLFSCFDDSGWISSISMIRVSVAVAVVMMVVAGFFTVNAVLAVILLKMVKYYGVLCVALGFNANVSLFKFVVLRRLGT